MCSLDTLLPQVPGTCLQSAVANLKHSSWQENRLFSWWTTVSWVRTMIVLLPENPGSGGRVGAERGRGLVTQPGVRHLLRGPLLLVCRIPVLEQTPLTFSKVWALLERQSLGIFHEQFFSSGILALTSWYKWTCIYQPLRHGVTIKHSFIFLSIGFSYFQEARLSKRSIGDVIWLRSRFVEKNVTLGVFCDR